MKCLGSSKVSSNLRIKIVKEAAEILDVKEGDRIIFYEGEKKEILIKKG
jgi:bifunctional DNA-binding transcriptional regulator/antitoxin component of YhaV-PrlF toxin-antitoxin module